MIRVPPGDHLLRLTAVSPANFGETGGSAVVDRPVAVDAFDELPYLPSSALKGVVAGRHGNADGRSPVRRRLYGSGDVDEDGSGEAGALVFGDGEPLCFPVPLRDGGRATVVVARNLFRLRRLGLAALPGLRRVDRVDAYQGEVSADLLPARVRWVDFGLAQSELADVAAPGDDAPVIVAAPAAALALWRAAVEERTLTRIGGDGLVHPGSLRTVELIPAGSVFLSLLSNALDEEIELDDGPWQVGAWESAGCGYLVASIWQPPALGASGEVPVPPAAGGFARPHETMVRAYEAARAIAAGSAAAIARSAIYDLGPRLRIRGLPATLAFCLAKAAGDEEAPGRRGRERVAYRWLLRTLFDLGPQADQAAIHARAAAAIGGEEPAPVELETTWLWLRRYAETMLRPEGTDA